MIIYLSHLFLSNTHRPDKNKEDTLLSLEKEINIDYKRTMNKITFDKIVTSDRETFGFVTVPPPVAETRRERGCITDAPEYDFDGQFYNFSFVSLLTRKEAIDALSKVRVECNKVSAMSLFQIPNKHMKLEEFEQAQTQQTYQVTCFFILYTQFEYSPKKAAYLNKKKDLTLSQR